MSINNITIKEVNLSSLSGVIGKCGETASAKAAFLKKDKSYKLSDTLTSAQYQANIDNNMERVSEFLDDANVGRLETRIEQVSLNTGIMPPNSWDESINPLDNVLYMSIQNVILDRVNRCIKLGAAYLIDKSIPLRFNITSSVGVIGDKGTPEVDCAHSVTLKNKLLDKYLRGELSAPAVRYILVGARAQADSKLKFDKRPATIFDGEFSNKLVSTTVYNPHHGFRIRPVAGFPWDENVDLMALNAALFGGLHEDIFLSNVWEFTHHNIGDKYKGKFIICTDISNNDQKFIFAENDYIHKRLLGPIYPRWRKIYDDAIICGSYRDENDKARYYLASDFRKPLLSGEGLTTATNKVKHTTMQVYNHVINKFNLPHDTSDMKVYVDKLNMDVHSLFDNFDEYLDTDLCFMMNNNGDDTLDSFMDEDKAISYEEVALANPYADVGLEPPGFSGISFALDTEGRVLKQFAHMKSLFVKGIETERRDVTSKLGRLPFNSLLGKTKFMLSYPEFDAEHTFEALNLYYDMNNYFGTSEQLVKLAADEAQKVAKDDARQGAILEVSRRMNLNDPGELYYKHTTEEIMAAAGDLFDDLFIHRPIEDVLKGELAEYIESL